MMGLKLFVLFTIIGCAIVPSLGQGQDPCPGVTPLPRNSFDPLGPYLGPAVLYKISDLSTFSKITDNPTCSYGYLQGNNNCAAVNVNFGSVFHRGCSTSGTYQPTRYIDVVRFINSSFGQDSQGNLLYIEQELQSVDDTRHIYKTGQFIVREATTTNLVLTNLNNPQPITDFYTKNVIAMIATDNQYFMVFISCNNSGPILSIFASTDIYNPGVAPYITAAINNWIQTSQYSSMKFTTLTGQVTPYTTYIQTPYMIPSQAVPPECQIPGK